MMGSICTREYPNVSLIFSIHSKNLVISAKFTDCITGVHIITVFQGSMLASRVMFFSNTFHLAGALKYSCTSPKPSQLAKNVTRSNCSTNLTKRS